MGFPAQLADQLQSTQISADKFVKTCSDTLFHFLDCTLFFSEQRPGNVQQKGRIPFLAQTFQSVQICFQGQNDLPALFGLGAKLFHLAELCPQRQFTLPPGMGREIKRHCRKGNGLPLLPQGQQLLQSLPAQGVQGGHTADHALLRDGNVFRPERSAAGLAQLLDAPVLPKRGKSLPTRGGSDGLTAFPIPYRQGKLVLFLAQFQVHRCPGKFPPVQPTQ
ncbi:unknown [Clostridium sp. CAG:1013]|nr:unknown [Clostridium sp. CAG:1013]